MRYCAGNPRPRHRSITIIYSRIPLRPQPIARKFWKDTLCWPNWSGGEAVHNIMQNCYTTNDLIHEDGCYSLNGSLSMSWSCLWFTPGQITHPRLWGHKWVHNEPQKYRLARRHWALSFIDTLRKHSLMQPLTIAPSCVFVQVIVHFPNQCGTILVNYCSKSLKKNLHSIHIYASLCDINYWVNTYKLMDFA